MLCQFWTHPDKITVGEVPGAYFIKLLFGSWHGACLLIDIER